ncbi:FUSC family protein [Streptomyces sp. NPDC091271]|uniref:FUSC family protein n=1 Tax=Streptomyces sp. NPDC091271 TaxID=3365980 RepID=UPI0038299AA7
MSSTNATSGAAAGWAARLAKRLAAMDPGLARWRVAWAATVSMGVALAVEFAYVRLAFPGRSAQTAMLLGAVAAMQGSALVLQRSAAARLRFGLTQPVAAGAGLSAGVLAHAAFGSGWQLDCALVVATFPAVAVRRFGPAFSVLGLMGWAGFYIATIFAPPLSDLPFLLSAEAVSGVCAGALALVLFRHRPRASLRHVLRAWHAQAAAVFRRAERLLDEPGARRRDGLASRHGRLAHTALVVEGWLADPGADANESAVLARHRLIGSQSAIDTIVASVLSLTVAGRKASPDDPGVRAAVETLRRLAQSDHRGARRGALRLLDLLSQHPDTHEDTCGDLRRLSTAVIALADAEAARADGTGALREAAEAARFTPVVAVAASGALPGAAGPAAAIRPRGAGLLGCLGRKPLSLPMRQAVQTTVAMALTVPLGRLVSPAQSYWSLIAVFIVFLGPATREELAVKGRDRVVGTLAGVVAAVPVNHLIHGDTAAVIVVALVSCLLGHFLVNLSYSYMAFFITVCVFQLYANMHQYETGMLVTRITETALGAAVAIAVAALVLPVSARDIADVARRRYLRSVGQLLDDIETSVATGEWHDEARLGMRSRIADEHARQLTAAARPLAQLSWTPTNRERIRAGLEGHAALASRLRGLTVSLFQAPNAFSQEGAAIRYLAHLAHSLAEPRTARGPENAHPLKGEPNPVTHHLHQIAELLHAALPAGSPLPSLPDSDRPDGAVLSGYVRARTGAPIDGATVIATDPGSGALAARTRGGTDGLYRLRSHTPGVHMITVSAPAHEPLATWALLDHERPGTADFVLDPAGDDTGPGQHVVDDPR